MGNQATTEQVDESLVKAIEDLIEEAMSEQAHVEPSSTAESDKEEEKTETDEVVQKAGAGGDTNSEKTDEVKSDEDAKRDSHQASNGGKDIYKAEDAKEDDEDEDEDKKKAKKEDKKDMKKSFQISEKDYEILQKAKTTEQLKKAHKDAEDLKKSVSDIVDEKMAPISQKLDDLMKHLSKPQARKSIGNVTVLEKSFVGNEEGDTAKLTKSDVLNAMEPLVYSKEISENSLIEYEGTGTISNRQDYKVVQDKILNKKN